MKKQKSDLEKKAGSKPKKGSVSPVHVHEEVMPSWMKIGRKYYWISSSAQVTNMLARIHKKIFVGDDSDKSLLKSNNYFRNKQEAVFTFKAFRGKF